MRIRHVTFRHSPAEVARMVGSRAAALEVLEAMESMEVTVRHAGVMIGRPLRSRDCSVEVLPDESTRRPVLNLPMPAGAVDVDAVALEVTAVKPLHGVVTVVFEITKPRRDGAGGWIAAETTEREYEVRVVGEAGAAHRVEA